MAYQFAHYRFDEERGLEGPAGRIPLRRSETRLLQLVLEADGRTVSKDAILSTVWQGREVSEDSITQAVRRLRAALPTESGTEIIQTVYGLGVRIGVRVRRGPVDAAGPRPAFAMSRSIEATASLTSAREMAARRTPLDLATALEAANRAIELDPEFVAAWCALADFHVFRAGRMIAPPREAGAAAVRAADRALALDPTCSAALADRGWVRAVIELDIAAGLADFQSSLRITDAHWLARGLHGWALIAAGRLDDATREMQACSDLNPWAAWSGGVLAWYRLLAGDHAAALAEARRAVQRFPQIEIAHQQHSMVASALQLHDEAVAAGRRTVELSPGTPLVHSALACALARAGQRDEATAIIQTIESADFPVASTWLASAHLALGRRDRALRSLEIARQTGAPQFVYAFADPRLNELNGDATFEGLRPRTG